MLERVKGEIAVLMPAQQLLDSGPAVLKLVLLSWCNIGLKVGLMLF